MNLTVHKMHEHPHVSGRPHSPAQGWSYRVPSPPRVIIPPPIVDARGVPNINIHHHQSSGDFESNGFTNTEFLKTVTYDNFVIVNSMLDWKYEYRRQAQQILPFLSLGPISAARDINYLKSHGITMVIAVRNTMSAHAKLLGSKAATELGIESKAIDVAGNQELIAAFPRGIELINTHLSAMYSVQKSKHAEGTASPTNWSSITPGKVLVYCESGNERSAALVAAYIMAMYSTRLTKAVQIVQAQRFAVAFDDAMKVLLQTYETILQAKRDVLQAGNGLSNQVTGTRNDIHGSDRRMQAMATKHKAIKRTLDEAYEEDMDVDETDRYTAGEGVDSREGYAPFQDRLTHE